MVEINITSAQWFNGPNGEAKQVIKAVIDGQVMWVPPVIDNKEYAEVMRQVSAGTLTIQDAE